MTLELAGALYPSIAHLEDADRGTWQLADQPGVAWFVRSGDDVIGHRSLGLPAEVVPVVSHLAGELERILGGDLRSNSHLPGLLIAAMLLADADVLERLGADQVVRRPARVHALDEDAGRHDPELEPHDAALRVWAPVSVDGNGAAVPSWPTVLEVAFQSGRRPRYVPWEGAGLTGNRPVDLRHDR